MHILVDMDDVLAQWSVAFKQRIREKYPRLRFGFLNDSHGWDLTHGLGPRGILAVRRTMEEPGFYANLPVMPGAVEALHEMEETGHTVTVCSTPWVSNPTCASDKLAWMERHFGEGWGIKTILTPDKTLVQGDVLIDDKPYIKGKGNRTWTQILFNAAHNQEVTHLRRMSSWDEWEDKVWDTSLESAASCELERTRLLTIS